MIELEERLRIELARSVGALRPAPDPMGRLLARRRRRRHRRTGALVAVVALVLAGGAVTTAGAPTRTPDALPTPDAFPTPDASATAPDPFSVITSEWTRQLLTAPTRGNLAADTDLVAELTRQLAGKQLRWKVDPALDRVKVLLVADVPGARVLGASYYNDTHAVHLHSAGPPGTSAAQLANGEFGGGVEGLKPFSVDSSAAGLTAEPASGESAYYVAALAPPGCQIATSRDARIEAGGTVSRTWVDQGDYVVRPGQDFNTWWRFICAGVVHDVRLGPLMLDTPAMLAGPPVTERGYAEPVLVTRAMAAWRSMPGLSVSRYRAVWGGTPSGVTAPVVVVVGEVPGGGVQVCALTGTGEFPMLTSAVAAGPLDVEGPSFAPSPGIDAGAAVTTAVAESADLVAVRLPDAANAYVLSDRLLVIAPAAATELRVTGTSPQTVPLIDGVGVITAKVPAGLIVRAVDNGGRTLAQLKIAEPDADGLVFGQALLQRW